MKKMRLIMAFIIICLLFVSASCAEKTETSKAPEAESKYLISSQFDANKKATIYDNLDYYGYYDFLDLIDRIEDNDIKTKFNIQKDVDPFYLLEDSDGGETYREINYTALARNYYRSFQSAVRQSGDYIISDFKDGVCINKLIFDKSKYSGEDITIEVPETIDGKKVLKLSGYIQDYGESDEFSDDCIYNERYIQHGFLTEFPDSLKIHLIIPSTVTDISSCGLFGYYELDDAEYPSGNITSIEVSPDNKVFSSIDGALYSKDKEWLLHFPYNYFDDKDFVVPKSVKYILDVFSQPDFTSLTIGRNVEHIYFDYFFNKNCTVYIYKDSYADKWFKSIDYKAEIMYLN